MTNRHDSDSKSVDTRPKLLVVTSTLPRFDGDPEPRFVLDLASALSNDFRITLLAPMDPKSAAQGWLESVAVVRYRYAPFKAWETLAYPGGIMPRLRRQPWPWIQVPLLLIGLFRAIRRLDREQQFDAIHCHWLVPQGLVALLARGNAARTPIIVTSHGGDLYTLNRWATRGLLSYTLRHASAITVVTEQLARLATELARTNAPPPTVIPMGVDTHRFHPGQRQARWASDAGVRSPSILFVGRIAEKKGIIFLIEAMNKPELVACGATLAIIGDGPLRSQLEQRVCRLGIAARVRFLGAIAHDRLPGYIAAVDLLVVPSIMAADGDCEGLPTVILEGLASGTAVVATAVGGIPEAIEDGVTGCLVPQQDAAALARAAARIIDDDALRSRLVDNGLRYVRHFSWERIGAAFAECLHAALARPNARD